MKILVADDHGLFRDSLAIWLEQYLAPVTVECAADFHQAEQQLQSNAYALAIFDLYMPGMQGAKSINRLAIQYPDMPIIVVSSEESLFIIQQCLKAGAKGYIPKSMPSENMLTAVHQVLNGGQYLPQNLLLEEGQTTELNQLQLSAKQLNILELLTKGRSNREIADMLSLSEGTVKQYVTKLLKLLGAENRVQASIKGRELLDFNIN